METTALLLTLSVMGGVWLYNRRALGPGKLLLAPAVWLTIFLVTALVKTYVSQNPIVSGYSHNEAWVSMNDNPHPESWELQYAGQDWPLLVVFLAPLPCALLLRVLDGWHFRYFLSIGIFAWIALLMTTCGGPQKREYYTKSELPPIGSRVSRSE